MKTLAFCLGLLAAAVGGLWLLQGIGVVHLRPILCFAECDELQGRSTAWALVGILMLVVGVVAVWWSWKQASA